MKFQTVETILVENSAGQVVESIPVFISDEPGSVPLEEDVNGTPIRIVGTEVTTNSAGQPVDALLAHIVAPDDMTWEEAWASGSVETLRSWFVKNTGPRLPLDTVFVGDYQIDDQADADALAGVLVRGRVFINATVGNILDFGVEWDGEGTGDNLVQTVNGSTATIEHFLLDGGYAKISYGLVGTTYSEGVTARYGDIRRMGGDGLRCHKNSTYQYLYIHDFRPWNVETDGPWNPAGDQSVYPHTDGIQVFRPGNVVNRCFVENTTASNATAALTLKPDADEAITSFTFSESYINGGGCNFYVDNQANNIDAPGANGQPTGLIFDDIWVGRDSRDNCVWRHDEVPSSSFTKTDVVWADTKSPVMALFVDDFNRANEALETRNFDRVSGVAGQLAINANQVQSVSIAAQGTYLVKEAEGIDPVNHFIEGDWKSGTTTGWLLARYADENNYVGMQILAGFPTLYNRIATNFLVRGASVAPLVAGDKIRIECRGRVVKFYHKGILRVSHDMGPGVLTSGRVGPQSRSVIANPMMDNLVAGSLSAPDTHGPRVAQMTTSADTANNTSLAFTLPPTVSAGTVGYVAIKTGAAVSINAVPAGWELVSELAAVNATTGMRIYRKTTPFVGNEGGTTITWTASGATVAAFAFLEAANTVGTVEATYASVLDPPAVAVPGAKDDTILWALSSCRRTDNDCTAAPSGYINGTTFLSETAAASTSSGHVSLAAAYREAEVVSENPGAFTWTGTLTIDLMSATIAIR